MAASIPTDSHVDASPLQRQLRKRRPFDSPTQEAHLNLTRTYEALNARFARLFRQYGISSSQYNILRILRGHGGEGVACQEIGDQMITQVPDVTRLVDRLESTGLAERRRTSRDRRLVLVAITDAGIEMLDRLEKPVLELHDGTLGHLTADELAELSRLLVKARQPWEGPDADGAAESASDGPPGTPAAE